MLFTPIASSRRVAAGRQFATLALLGCLILPLPAVAQTMTGERGDLPPAESVSLAGLGSAPSPFAGLFQPAAPVAFVRPNPAPVTFATAGTVALADAARDCPGCPRRRPVSAVLQTLGVNVAFNLVNRLRNPNDEFKVTLPLVVGEPAATASSGTTTRSRSTSSAIPTRATCTSMPGGPTASASGSRRRSPRSGAPPGSTSASGTTRRSTTSSRRRWAASRWARCSTARAG